MTLAEKILTLRTQHKLSQGDLAERLDVSRQSVSKWETAQAVPELDKIVKLADLFGVSVDELVREEAVPRPDTSRAGVFRGVRHRYQPVCRVQKPPLQPGRRGGAPGAGRRPAVSQL